MESQQVQRSNLGVSFMFKSLMKSLSKVARTEVLQRNIPEKWSVKDQTSSKENLHLGREDDIVRMVQVEGAKCLNTLGPTGAKGRPNQAEMGLGWSAQAGRPGPLRGSVRHPFSCTRISFNPKFLEMPPFSRQRAIRPRGHPQAREGEEEGDRSQEGSLYSKEAHTSGGEGRHHRKHHHDQRCLPRTLIG
jgi:hypothetical protein